MSVYDPSEALLLMADAKERARPDFDARRTGASELLSALHDLNNQYGFVMKMDDYGIGVTTLDYPGRNGKPESQIVYNDGIFTLHEGAKQRPITGLSWDHRNKQWRGLVMGGTADQPTRRSALAVLIGAVLDLPEEEFRDMHERIRGKTEWGETSFEAIGNRRM